MQLIESKAFNFLDHIDKLTSAKQKGRYHCPACGGDNFTFSADGKYRCWSGCDSKDIREAIAPWQGTKSNRLISTPRKAKLKPAPKPVLIPEGELQLARLPQPGEIPQKRKIGDRTQIIYPYSDSQWVSRIESADGKKEIRPWHIDAEGEEKQKKGNESWLPYRTAEVRTHGPSRWVLAVEGEKCVEVARSLGVVAFTFQGGSWMDEELLKAAIACKEAGVAGICYFPDHDETGYKKAEKMAIAAAKAQIPFILLDPTLIWKECPGKGDIADWMKWGMEQGWNKEEFVRRLEGQFNAAAKRNRLREDIENDDWEDDGGDEGELSIRSEITQVVFEAFYSDKPWISFENKLFSWEGNYYRHSPDDVEIRRITDFCNEYAVPTKSGLIFPYAKPGSVRQALEWCKLRLLVDSRLIDPAGLNCTNGVLQIEWNVVECSPVPSWRLIDHSPELYYTYEPLAKYDPEANGQMCDRLLEVLDGPQRDIFLKTIAASLDLSTIRRHKGRLVRALLTKGGGNNGKDTLREAVAAMYGRRGITGCTLSDFAMYDDGRKFPLARLKHSRVNWASENANSSRLDKIQSLKAFITGDTLSAEVKGRDESEFVPSAIALFNINDTPKLQGTLEAIASRYGVLSFNKTFKIGADLSKGELEADPRFKYDPNFLQDEVLPAFLNRVLDALQRLMVEGIDYSCTQKALEDIQAENSHLFQFCQDAGLAYEPNAVLTAGQIWERLEQWYLDNGTLTYEEDSKGRQKAVWSEQSDQYDRNIKAANQVLGRFQQLFPKAKRVVVHHPNEGRKKLQALQGIDFLWRDNNPDDNCDNNGDKPPTPNPTPTHPNPPQHPPQETTQNQGSHPSEANFSSPMKKNEKPPTDPCNVSSLTEEFQENTSTPQQLASLGWDDGISRKIGVGDWGGTGVGSQQTGVGEPQQSKLPIYQRGDGGFGIASEKEAAIAQAEQEAEKANPIQVGSRVRYTYPHSKRCGMVGTVKKIAVGTATIWLDYHNSISYELRDLVSALKDLELLAL